MKYFKKWIYFPFLIVLVVLPNFSLAAFDPGGGGGGLPPEPPTLYQPYIPVDGKITVLWSGVYGATSYKVYRSYSENGPYELIAETVSRPYIDDFVHGYNRYWYMVKAYIGSQPSEPSNIESIDVYEPKQSIPKGVDAVDADWVWNNEELYGYHRINVLSGRPAGEGIKVCIIDTGIDVDHSDLANNIKGGINYVDWPYTGSYNDGHGHGTLVAGVIAAQDGSITDESIIGVAPKVSIYVIKAGWNIYIYQQAVMMGLEWAIEHDMDIISMSFSFSNSWDIYRCDFETLLETAHDNGIILVAASGNQNNNEVRFPASHPDVIAVGAVSDDYSRLDGDLYGSNYGTNLDIVAPGFMIMSTYINNGYAQWSGTSMACPHVTGICALILSASDYIRFTLTGTARVNAVKECLFETADKGVITDYTEYEYGEGFVQADAAVDYAINYPTT